MEKWLSKSQSMPTRNLLIAISALFVIAGMARAERPALPQWKQRRSALDRTYQVDEFRIYYTLQGHDALPDAADTNGNAIPDRIENIALQLTTARDLYVDVLQLRHPLKGPRYRGQAKFIDVHVGTLPFTPGGKKNNGSAGDAVVNYYRPSDPEEGVEVLTIDICGTLSTRNITPAHELFHLFQYGYCMFKGSWFTEGTARWAEFAIREGSGEPTGLPLTREDLDKLFGKRYEAVGFWLTLAHAADTQGRLHIPQKLREVQYLGTDEPIICDSQFHGALLLKQVLEAMDDADDRAATDLKLDPFTWKEGQQRSPETYPYMWSAVLDVSRNYVGQSDQIQTMVQNLSP